MSFHDAFLDGWQKIVTPVKTGVQSFRSCTKTLDSSFRRNDGRSLSRDKKFTSNHTKNPSPVKGNQPAGEPTAWGLKQKSHPAQGRMAFFIKTVTVQQRRFAAAAAAREKSAKCASAHEQADDKADAVLLDG